jgi:hypothetical protein
VTVDLMPLAQVFGPERPWGCKATGEAVPSGTNAELDQGEDRSACHACDEQAKRKWLDSAVGLWHLGVPESRPPGQGPLRRAA